MVAVINISLVFHLVCLFYKSLWCYLLRAPVFRQARSNMQARSLFCEISQNCQRVCLGAPLVANCSHFLRNWFYY